MQYGVKVRSNGTAWRSAIHRTVNKKEAVRFANGVVKTGGLAYVVKRKSTSDGWKEIEK